MLGDFKYKPTLFDEESGDHEKLLKLIQRAPKESFLLAAVVDYLAKSKSSFADFERWLVAESGLSEVEQYLVRGKIAGKYLPRDEYQVYFPIGEGRIYAGDHVVTAHNPPDLDTAVASFWGWVDAFAARVSSDRHIWNFPGGAPTPQILRLFDGLVGRAVFEVAAQHKRVLNGKGTVTLRDFCNREETKIADVMEVISVVDHHRLSLQTCSFATVTICDTRSANTPLAEMAMALNDRYCCLETKEWPLSPETASEIRVAQKVLARRLADLTRGQYFVHPEREFCEYISFLYAILDDTDLLTRVTVRDLLCVAQLLNRLKTLVVGEDTEIIIIDDLPRDEQFGAALSRRILENEDMYSLYSKIYAHRREEVRRDLERCREGAACNVFVDTKEQKGCARVGQTKLFAGNVHWFAEHGDAVRQAWLEKAHAVHAEHDHLDLHLHMISTIADAEEVYRDAIGEYAHRDELWMWIPHTEEAHDRLATYLSGFKETVSTHAPSVELIGPKPDALLQIFEAHFSESPLRLTEATHFKGNMAVMRFRAGTVTSRKTHITPHVPKLS
jgi:hypothetical protein